MKIIKVSNGSTDYVGNFTPKELRIIKYNSKGKVLNLFSGKCRFGHIRVDYSFGNIKKDVFEFLNENEEYFDTIIIDAPYNKIFADKYQKLGNTPEQFIIFANVKKTNLLWKYILELKPERIILKSWNYYCPKGYFVKSAFLCYSGGYRKPTILLILKRGEI